MKFFLVTLVALAGAVWLALKLAAVPPEAVRQNAVGQSQQAVEETRQTGQQ